MSDRDTIDNIRRHDEEHARRCRRAAYNGFALAFIAWMLVGYWFLS